MGCHSRNFIDRIPLELLGEIFSFSVESCPNAPLALLKVSRAFYRAAKTTPQLWTSLCLELSPSSDTTCLQKAELWFSRAGGLSVGIQIQLQSPPHSRTARNEANNQWMDILHTPIFLSALASRIEQLSIQSPSALHIHALLKILYPTDDAPASTLRTLRMCSTPDSAFPSFRSVAASSVLLPAFPNLTHLSISNHVPPKLASTNLQNLRTLAISIPIRLPAIPTQTILSILRSSNSLERFEFDGRTIDDIPASHQTSQQIPPPPQGGVPSSAYPVHQPQAQAHATSTVSSHLSVTLPHLSKLSLRTNHLPALLSRLILPNLHTLNIDDLDGKRASGAKETSTALRQLLVRMELPCEGRKGSGLKVLKLHGVGMRSRHRLHATPHHHDSHPHGTHQPMNDDSGVEWDWCFRRMRTLEQLIVSKVHPTTSLLTLITPQRNRESNWRSGSVGSTAKAGTVGGMGNDEAPSPPLDAVSESPILPHLKRLTVIECSSTFSSAIVQFRLHRPEVAVAFEVTPDSVSSETEVVRFSGALEPAMPSDGKESPVRLN